MRTLLHSVPVMSALLIVVLFSSSVSGAGVTIITHGFALSPFGDVPWVDSMVSAVDAKWITVGEGTSSTSIARIYVLPSLLDPSGLTVATEWSESSSPSSSGEVVVILDWIAVADHFLTGFDTKQVAAAVVDLVTQTHFGSHPLAELPIHLIGHSRGGTLVCDLARQLGEQGLWIDQVTTLDPHPVLAVVPIFGLVDDPNPATYENVLFADNYYQEGVFKSTDGGQEAQDYPDGRSVEGAYNRYVSQDVLNSGGYDTYGGIAFASHQDIHLWYHGTADTTTAFDVYDGGATLDTALRGIFYIGKESGGKGTGFRFSRLAESTLGRKRNVNYYPYDSSVMVNSGYSIFVGGTGIREGLDKSGARWPNLLAVDIVDDGSRLDAGEYACEVTSTLQIRFTYSCYHSSATVSFYLDDDLNPYNGLGGEVGSVSVAATENVDSATVSINSPTTGQYFICGKITDNDYGNTRYEYAYPHIDFQEAPPTTFFVSAYSGQHGSVDPTGTVVVSQGDDLVFFAYPELSYESEYWYLDGGAVQPGGDTFGLTNIQASHSVYVTFESNVQPSRSITVDVPDGGEDWFRCRTQHIAWHTEGDLGDQVNINLLQGSSILQEVVSPTYNDGNYGWYIELPGSCGEGDASNYRVVVSSLDGTVADTSDAYFRIRPWIEIDTIEIWTCSDLQSVATGGAWPPDKYYKLMTDIDARDCGNFDPIGSPGSYFRGTFDGQGHSITRFEIERPTESDVGLFRVLDEEGVIKNLYIETEGIDGLRDVGILVGINEGTIINCHASIFLGSNITAAEGPDIGGLVGDNSMGAVILSSSVELNGGIRMGGTSPHRAGGLAGINSGLIKWCRTYGEDDINIDRDNQGGGAAGGLVGNQTAGGQIIESYSSIRYIAGSNDVGGLVGLLDGGDVLDCYYSGSTVRGDYEAGGIAGTTEGGTIANCYVTGCPNAGVAGADEGSLVGDHGGVIRNSLWCSCFAAATGNGGTVIDSRRICDSLVYRQAYESTGWDFSNVWAICEGDSTPVLRGIGAPLQVPIGFAVAEDQSDGVHVSWEQGYYTAGCGNHSAWYCVLRSNLPEPSAAMTNLSGWQSASEFVDTSAIPGVTYYYWVKSAATMNGARESYLTTYISGQRTYPPASAPTNVTATDSLPMQVLVEWYAVSGTSYYRVFRSSSADGEKTALGSWQNLLSFIDTPPHSDTIYYYWVAAAVDSLGTRMSDFGDPDTGYYIQPDITPPALSLSIFPESPVQTQTIEFTVTSVDNELLEYVVTYWCVNGVSDSASWSNVGSKILDTSFIVGTFLADDTMTYWAVAVDAADNEYETDHRSIVVLPELVTTPSRPQGPIYLRSDQEVSYVTGSSVTNLGSSVQYRLDWGDSTVSGWGDSTQSHAWPQDGIYNVRSQARSSLDTTRVSAWSVSTSVLVDSRPPEVTIASNAGSDITSTDSIVTIDGVSLEESPTAGIMYTYTNLGDTVLNSGDSCNWSFDVALSPSDNQLIVTVSSLDYSGNIGRDSISISYGLPKCCIPPSVGDVDQSGAVDITDLSVMIDHQYLSLRPLDCAEEGDINFDELVDVTDLQTMIDYEFLSLTPFPACE